MLNIKLSALLLLPLLLLTACGTFAPEPEPPAQFVALHSENGVLVEARRLVRLDAGDGENDYCFLELRITNGSDRAIAFSSLLCARVSELSGRACTLDEIVGMPEETLAAVEGYAPLDGYISAGASKEGFLFFKAQKSAESFKIELAADYGNNVWLSFELGSADDE